MKFEQFLDKMNVVSKQPLLASDAHLKMAPLERVQYLQNYDYSAQNPKASAVLSLFYPKNNLAHLLLIVRSSYPGVHSSQIAFPGGKKELEDLNLQETALREANEEVGISPSEIEIVKQWSDLYIPPSNFMVSAFMGISQQPQSFVLQPDEVSGIIELPVEDLLNDSLVQNVRMTTSYATDIEVPAFVINDHIVWGATAMILSEIKETFRAVF